MDTPSPLAAAADRLLQTQGTSLVAWLQERVNTRRTNQEMADALREATDGVVEVSGEAVRRWVKHYELVERESAA